MRNSVRRRRFNVRGLSLIKLVVLFLVLTQGAVAQEKTCLEQLKDSVRGRNEALQLTER